MDINIKDMFDKDAKRLGYLYGFAKSKSAKKRIAFDLCKFQVLYEKMISCDYHFKWDSDDEIFNQIYINNRKDFLFFVNNYVNNYDFYSKSSSNVLDIYKSVDYNFDYRDGFHKSFSYDEACLILKDFFASLGDKYYCFFNDLLSSNFLYMDYPDKSDAGFTFDIGSIFKSYAVCSSSVFSLYSMSVIVHEVGHCYERMLQYNSCSCVNDFGSILYEVSSCFFELLFIRYLEDKRICPKDSYIVNDLYLNDFYNNMFELNLICDFKDVLWDAKANLDVDKDLISKRVEYFNNLYCGNNRYYDYCSSNKINVRDSMSYGYGALLSFHMYEKYLEDREYFLKGFDDIMMTYFLINDFSVFERVNISSNDFYDNKPIRKVLSKYMDMK